MINKQLRIRRFIFICITQAFVALALSACNQIGDPLPSTEYKIEWSPDSQSLAVGGKGLFVFPDKFKEPISIKNPSNTQEVGLAWSPNSDRLADVYSDGNNTTIRVSDPITGSPISKFDDQKMITAIAWSPIKNEIAIGDKNKVVTIWEATTHKNLLSFTGHTAAILSVAWSPDGTKLISAGGDKTIRIWSVVNGNLQSTISTTINYVYSTIWSPTGDKIAAAGDSGQVYIWNSITGQLDVTIKDFVQGQSPVYQLAWSPNGSQIAIAASNEIVIWNITKGQIVLTLKSTDRLINAVSWSPNGTNIASIGVDNVLRIWDAISGKLLVEHEVS